MTGRSSRERLGQGLQFSQAASRDSRQAWTYFIPSRPKLSIQCPSLVTLRPTTLFLSVVLAREITTHPRTHTPKGPAGSRSWKLRGFVLFPPLQPAETPVNNLKTLNLPPKGCKLPSPASHVGASRGLGDMSVRQARAAHHWRTLALLSKPPSLVVRLPSRPSRFEQAHRCINLRLFLLARGDSPHHGFEMEIGMLDTEGKDRPRVSSKVGSFQIS